MPIGKIADTPIQALSSRQGCKRYRACTERPYRVACRFCDARLALSSTRHQDIPERELIAHQVIMCCGGRHGEPFIKVHLHLVYGQPWAFGWMGTIRSDCQSANSFRRWFLRRLIQRIME